jgi:hypothetical protein
MKTLATLLLAAAFASAAHAMPNRIAAEYELTSRGLAIGRVTESFVRRGDRYEIQSVSRAEGALKVFYDEQITVQSSGRVDETGLKPLQFEERRSRDAGRDVTASFDWDKGVMQSRYRGETTEHALPPSTQDRISMMYQFMNVKRREGNLTLAMSNGRKVETYVYRFVDEPRITTPAGEFDTLHLERVTSSPNDRHVEVWLAKDRHNFPVRVVFDDPRGFRVEQALVTLRTD